MTRNKFNDLSDLRSLFPASGDAEQQTDASRRDRAPEDGPMTNKPGTADRAIALSKLHVQLEKKGRRGKGVTVIKGFFHTTQDLERFARDLKTRCGSGGTVKDDTIEIQGDHRNTAVEYFRALGFRVTGGR